MALKYFIIQSAASTLLLLSVNYETNIIILLFTRLIVKIALIPIHSWFLDINIKAPIIGALILISRQKFIPIYLLIFLKTKIIIIFLPISILIRTTLQYLSKNTIIILRYSSIFNIRWIILIKVTNLKIIIIFIIIYSINLLFLFKLLTKSTKKQINWNDSYNIIIIIIIICSLAGLPPIMGFIPKWIFIKEIRILNLNFLILFILLISSINIYIYLRIFISILLKKKLLKTKKNQLNLLQKFILVTNILPFILFI